MNVRPHAVRALISAGLILTPLSVTAQIKAVATSDTSSKTTASPGQPYLRLVPENVPGSVQKNLSGGSNIPSYPGGQKQTLWTSAKAGTGGAAAPSKTTTKSNSTTTLTRTSMSTSTSFKSQSVQSVDSMPLQTVQEQLVASLQQTSMSPPTDTSIQVTVMARQNTCNGGPQIPAKVSYVLGEGEPVVLFDGANVEPGMSTSFILPVGNALPLKFIANFQATAPCPARNRYSDHANQALNIIQGTPLLELIEEKRINLVYDGQTSMLSYLVPTYVDPQTGYGILPETQSVIAFEYMDFGAGSMFDMNDLMILVEGSPIYQDHVMYDGLGPDSTATDYQIGLSTQILTGHTSYTYPASEFVAPSAGTLSQFEVIGYFYGANPNPLGWDYELHIWSSWEQVNASRLSGDVGNFFFFEPTTMDTYGDAPLEANGTSTYRLMFDLSGGNVALAPGAHYIVGFGVYGSPGTSGYFRASTTLLEGLQAKYVTAAGLFSASGRLGYRISETVVGGQIGQMPETQPLNLTSEMSAKSAGSESTD